MAIQLNERDHQIFKLLDEHQVLLEKHISWFVATEDKPVLIRDRLRKLFYLDYLICQRYDTKLPWWTTPTKPLVYMLSPLARTASGAIDSPDNLDDNEWKREHLEIANIRMLFIISQKEGYLQSFQWHTCADKKEVYDATVSTTVNGINCKVGIISNPASKNCLLEKFDEDLKNKRMTQIMVVSGNKENQGNLQKQFAGLIDKANVNSIIFGTHQDLYKSGLAGMQWQNANGERTDFPNNSAAIDHKSNFGTIEAA